MNELIAIQKVAAWEKLKALVRDSVSSPITKRVYNMALDEFLAWFQQAPRPGFTKATVSAWRVSLEARKLGSSPIIIRMSAIQKLAAEAAGNGLLAHELAAGIARVKSAKTQCIRTGKRNRTLLSRSAKTLSWTLHAPWDQRVGWPGTRISQISRAYSSTMRSLEKGPIRATFRMDIRVQRSPSTKDWPALAWASEYGPKSAR